MLIYPYTESNLPTYDYPAFKANVESTIMHVINNNSSHYLKTVITSHFEKTGKMIRPYFVFELGKLTLASKSHLIDWASTCEILHNATLIHDDIQDRDTHRRGKPTLWTRYGDNQAINAGDFLMLSALQPVLKSTMPDYTKNELLLIYSKMACRIVNGQNLEFELNGIENPELIYQTYFDCISQKTAALFADLALGVNTLSTSSPFSNEDIYHLFSQIGILFQIQDDMMDLYGEKQRDTRGCDIKEGKMSFLIATHILHFPEDFARLNQILKKPRLMTTNEDIQIVKDLFQKKGSLDLCQQKIVSMKADILSLDLLKKSVPMQNLIHHLLQLIENPKR